MTVNNPHRMKPFLVSDELYEFFESIKLLYPKGAFIRPCLHPEGGLNCLIHDATRSRPGLVVRITGAVHADPQQLQLPLGGEVRP
jgi:hypothetical protein